MKTYKQTIIAIVLGLTLAAGLSYAASWTGPTANPPLANTEAPINAGDGDQFKGGGVSFGSLISRGGAVVGGKMVVGGKIKIGDDAVSPSAGDIRWTGSDFEGYIGTQWLSFTKDTQGGGGKVAAAKYQKFISSGVFSVPEGVTTVWVTMGGGGGGGGGGMVNYNAIVAPGGGGGQGQSVVLKEISVPSGATIPVTVGAGGAGGVSGSFIYKRRPPLSPRGNAGADGGSTSFGSFVSVAGGGGGKIGTIINKKINNPGVGGAIGGQPGRCDINVNGKEDVGHCFTVGNGPAYVGDWSAYFTVQYGGSGGGGGGGGAGAYNTIRGPLALEEYAVINYFEHFNFPAQNGISTSLGGGGGGGGIVKVNTLTNTSSRIEPLHTNGGNGGAGHAVVYWCDAGWTLVPGKEGDLCQK